MHCAYAVFINMYLLGLNCGHGQPWILCGMHCAYAVFINMYLLGLTCGHGQPYNIMRYAQRLCCVYQYVFTGADIF